MKKKLVTSAAFGVMGLCVALGVGCGETKESASQASGVYKIVITGDQTLNSFSDGKLNATVYKDEVKTDETVTFTSKSEELLKIDANGNMEAQNLTGTAIVEISHASGLKENVSVGIVNPFNLKPYFTSTIANDQGEINILEESSSNVGLSFTYESKAVSGATFSYTLDTNDYITLNEQTGDITSKAIGQTAVSVTATWRGYSETLNLKVNVCEDVQVEIAGANITDNVDGTKSANLYKFNAEIDGVAYTNNLQLSCNANGAEGSVKEWISSDESVVKVSKDGLVEVVGVGTAEVRFVFETAYFSYTSLPLNVAVTIPIIERNTRNYFVELCETPAINAFAIDSEFLFGKEVAIDKVSIDATETAITEGKIDLTSFGTGEFAAIFTSTEEGYSVKVPFTIATKVIKTAEELAALYTYANATEVTPTEGDGKFYDYDGYFVLGNDIECAGTEVVFSAPHGNSVQSSLNNTYLVSGKGFRGIFDGKGYAIKDANFWAGGLFGEVASGAVIRNTKFENATVYYAWGVTTGILGVNLAAATIENCYFDVACAHYPSADGYGNGSAVLAGWTYYGAKIKNCVFNMRENAESLPLVRFEGGTWNGIQGPYLAENVVIVYQTAEGNMIADREGQTSIRVENYVNRNVVNVLESALVRVSIGNGVAFEVKTDDAEVLAIDGKEVSPLKVGTANIWVEFSIGDYKVETAKTEITVVEEAPKEYIEITSEEELRELSGAVSEKPYKLVKDITISEPTTTVIGALDSVLDLNGYTLTFIVGNGVRGSFIGEIATNGVLRNGKVVVSYGYWNDGYNGGVFIKTNNGRVENVEVSVTRTVDENNSMACVFGGGSGVYENLVIKATTTVNKTSFGIFSSDAQIKNCIVIGNIELMPYGMWGTTKPDLSEAISLGKIVNLGTYADVNVYTAANYDTTSFSSDYWTINETTKLPEIILNVVAG